MGRGWGLKDGPQSKVRTLYNIVVWGIIKWRLLRTLEEEGEGGTVLIKGSASYIAVSAVVPPPSMTGSFDQSLKGGEKRAQNLCESILAAGRLQHHSANPF